MCFQSADLAANQKCFFQRLERYVHVSSGARMGSAPFALFQPVIRAPVFGRAYSAAPTLFHADLSEFYGNRRAKVPNILREGGEPFRFLNAE
jgi:hypothetical protein